MIFADLTLLKYQLFDKRCQIVDMNKEQSFYLILDKLSLHISSMKKKTITYRPPYKIHIMS